MKASDDVQELKQNNKVLLNTRLRGTNSESQMNETREKTKSLNFFAQLSSEILQKIITLGLYDMAGISYPISLKSRGYFCPFTYHKEVIVWES